GLALQIFWRIRGILSPYVATHLEYVRLGQMGIALALQILLEKWKHDVLAVVLACVGGELHSSQMLPLIASPSAVHPWSHHQRVEDPGVLLVDRVKSGERPLQVLGIEPPADRQHGAVDV